MVFLSWHRASVATRRWNHLVLTTAVHRNSPMAGKINEPQGNAESAFEYSDVVQFLPVQYDSRRDRAERIRTGVQSRKEPMRSNPARKQIGVVHPSASLVSVARRYRWGVTMTRAGTGCRLVGVTWRCDIGYVDRPDLQAQDSCAYIQSTKRKSDGRQLLTRAPDGP